jgi:DUF1680 family protein
MAHDRLERNTRYLLSLRSDNLLRPFWFEAGLYQMTTKKTGIHWGWDSPFSYIRGTFTGHWLSAAAQVIARNENRELRVKAEHIVDEIARCQKENGGRWAFGIPEKYLYWLRDGKVTWASQYVCHKVMMGLLDMHRFLGNETALPVVKNCADWFYDFTSTFDRKTMDEMMDRDETGGIMELWADLYGITGDERHLELIRRYERPRLYDVLLEGGDALTNMHANTTVPEIHGCARAYEVTGDLRYREIAELYWKCAVDDRGFFVTGGQTSGEIWTPPFRQAARLSDRNQELCVVYNMMRLAGYLYAWTGDVKYADYCERNLYNGVFAQSFWQEDSFAQAVDEEDNPLKTGHLAYYLPLRAGSVKKWGRETDHFWCCHCTSLQANANVGDMIYHTDGAALVVAQYLPSKLETEIDGRKVSISQRHDALSVGKAGDYFSVNRRVRERPRNLTATFDVQGGGSRFALKFRKPWWLSGEISVRLNGEPTDFADADGYAVLDRAWENDEVEITLPKKLRCFPLADRPGTAAFIDGPVALAGLCGEERELYGDIEDPESFMEADDERYWNIWRPAWRTVGQPVNFGFVPLHDIGHETYTVYFPITKTKKNLDGF